MPHYSRWYRHGDPLAGGLPRPKGRTIIERFWTKVEFTETCWLWTSTRDQGYGKFYDGSRDVRAHRWAYEFCVGPIPDGLTIDHLCRVRCCVLPDHLEVVTGRINTLRGFGPPALNALKTHCLRGHPYDEANTYVFPGTGWRRCRTCFREEWAAR